MRILVVEDNIELSEVIEKDLFEAGFDVVVANSGIEARQLLLESDFDLVLSDWKLPGVGGLDLLGFVRQKVGIPFVFMTGFAEDIETEDVYTSGATVFLAKPFDGKTLHAAVSKALGLQEAMSLPLQELLKR